MSATGNCIAVTASQSLLHQVCGWIQTLSAQSTRLQSLNPFFIRSAVGLRKEGRTRNRKWVSIPSSSGLRLDWNEGKEEPTFGRSQSLLHQVCGWIEHPPRTPQHRPVSIPSSSGLRLDFDQEDGKRTARSLNPFFIRSAVGLKLTRSLYHISRVSIPSSSGLRLDYNAIAIYESDHMSQSLLHQVCGWILRFFKK